MELKCILHVILDYILIFGIGSFDGWGLKGAAIAMILARLYAFLRLLIKSQQIPSIALRLSDFKLIGSLAGSMIKFAVPATVERLSMRLGQVVYFGLIVRMGGRKYMLPTISRAPLPHLVTPLVEALLLQPAHSSVKQSDKITYQMSRNIESEAISNLLFK
ncbi:hypothetical protein ACFVHQ_03470 [Actinomycetes bacterium NPDC127524]